MYYNIVANHFDINIIMYIKENKMAEKNIKKEIKKKKKKDEKPVYVPTEPYVRPIMSQPELVTKKKKKSE